MRLVTLDSREVGGRPGISLPSGEILDLSASPSGLTAAQWRPQSVVSVLAEGEEGSARVARLISELEAAPDAQRQEWRNSGRLLPTAGTRLMPPIRRPGLLLMVADRSDGRSSCYVKNPNSAAGPDATIACPEGDDSHLFLLGMIGLVVGRPLFRATEAQAARAVAALTLVADLGTRRLAGGPDDGRADARQFPGACIIGPALVTLDEVPVAAGWEMVVRVNGRAVGSGTSDLNPERAAGILASLSGRYAFRPGDIVGVPAGVGEFELPGASRVTLALGSTLELGFSTSG
ncbi:MAG: fumarylacetoacetate hydrolase family protein [Gammaproteobacteria bacterium]